MPERISVVIAAFNCAGCIGRALQSLGLQSRPVDEVIVVDDGSVDSLREAVQPPVRYVRHEVNRGISAARNTGARMSTGDYLVFLDADDTLAPDAIEKMLLAMQRTAASWCITDICRIEGGHTSVLHSQPPEENRLAALLANDFVLCGIFFRRADFEDIGMYDETLRARVDWDISIRMIEAGKPYCYVAEPLYRYCRREGSIQTGDPRNVIAGTKRVFEKHHRRLAPTAKEFSRAYGTALWVLGRMNWGAKYRCAGIYCGIASALRERSLRRVFRFLRRKRESRA